MTRKLFVIATFATWVAWVATAKQGEAAVLKVDEFNSQGMSFFLAEDHANPNIALGLAFKTGAAADPEGKEGLSRLTMEMLMRGTKSRDHTTINENIEYMGASLSPSVAQSVLTLGGETLTRYRNDYMQLLADVLLNPSFPEGELKKLKK